MIIMKWIVTIILMMMMAMAILGAETSANSKSSTNNHVLQSAMHYYRKRAPALTATWTISLLIGFLVGWLPAAGPTQYHGMTFSGWFLLFITVIEIFRLHRPGGSKPFQHQRR